MLRSMRCIFVPLLLAGASVTALAQSAQPRVFFVAPSNGATVANPVVVKFGVEGMAIKPAGDMTPDTGHHHLIIDGDPFRQVRLSPPTTRTCILAKARPRRPSI